MRMKQPAPLEMWYVPTRQDKHVEAPVKSENCKNLLIPHIVDKYCKGREAPNADAVNLPDHDNEASKCVQR
jgi:hypothetical protein